MNIIFNLLWNFSETEREFTYTSKITLRIVMLILVVLCLFISAQLLSLLHSINSEIKPVNQYLNFVKPFFLLFCLIFTLSHLGMLANIIKATVKGKADTKKGERFSIFSLKNENPYTVLIEK